MHVLLGVEQAMAELRSCTWSHLQGRPRNACCLKREVMCNVEHMD